MSFEKAFAHTLKWEGGYANITEDKGGETYMGIARRFHPTWPGWEIIDDYKRLHGKIGWNQKLANDKLFQYVRAFYHREKWLKFSLNAIQDSEVAMKAFDMIVNHGRGSALVQQAVNASGGSVSVDNYVGPKTVAAINSVNPRRLFNNLLEIRRQYYHSIVERSPSQRKFLEGWLRRLESFEKKK